MKGIRRKLAKVKRHKQKKTRKKNRNKNKQMGRSRKRLRRRYSPEYIKNKISLRIMLNLQHDCTVNTHHIVPFHISLDDSIANLCLMNIQRHDELHEELKTYKKKTPALYRKLAFRYGGMGIDYK